jgi:hypothetical protein
VLLRGVTEVFAVRFLGVFAFLVVETAGAPAAKLSLTGDVAAVLGGVGKVGMLNSLLPTFLGLVFGVALIFVTRPVCFFLPRGVDGADAAREGRAFRAGWRTTIAGSLSSAESSPAAMSVSSCEGATYTSLSSSCSDAPPI